ncbi:receptor-like protein kinase HERK 1, partial [Tanacetum coccineum]
VALVAYTKLHFPYPRQLSGHPIATLAVAIKRGNGKFVQGESKYENVEQRKYEFEMEIRLLSRFKHRNIVSLIGFCHEDDMHWGCNGLKYLHLGYVDQVKTVRGIHGDIKSANILLDQNFQAVIGDFGLSTFSPRKEQLISSFNYRRAGTPGFVDPYYVKTRRLSEKVDIYSFGVLLLEVLSGKSASNLADKCLQNDPVKRPKMTDIKREVENLLKIRVSKLFPTPGDNKMVAIKRFNHQMQTEVEFLIDILMLNDFKHENVIAVQGFHYGENEKIV